MTGFSNYVIILLNIKRLQNISDRARNLPVWDL